MSGVRTLLAGVAAAAMTPAQAAPVATPTTVSDPLRILHDGAVRVMETTSGGTIWVDTKARGETIEFSRDMTYFARRADDGSRTGLLMTDYSVGKDGTIIKRDWSPEAVNNAVPYGQGYIETRLSPNGDATMTIMKQKNPDSEPKAGRAISVPAETQVLKDEIAGLTKMCQGYLAATKPLEARANAAGSAHAGSVHKVPAPLTHGM